VVVKYTNVIYFTHYSAHLFSDSYVYLFVYHFFRFVLRFVLNRILSVDHIVLCIHIAVPDQCMSMISNKQYI